MNDHCFPALETQAAAGNTFQCLKLITGPLLGSTSTPAKTGALLQSTEGVHYLLDWKKERAQQREKNKSVTLVGPSMRCDELIMQNHQQHEVCECA